MRISDERLAELIAWAEPESETGYSQARDIAAALRELQERREKGKEPS